MFMFLPEFFRLNIIASKLGLVLHRLPFSIDLKTGMSRLNCTLFRLNELFVNTFITFIIARKGKSTADFSSMASEQTSFDCIDL